MAALACLILVFLCLKVNCNDVDSLREEQLILQLQSLRNYKGIQRGQYLVVTVVSYNILTDRENWYDAFQQLQEQNRVKLVLNKDKNTYHGERQVVEEKILEDLIRKCKSADNTGDNNPPVVVMYSKYIPCSGLRNAQKQCSEVLMDWILSYNENIQQKVLMVVAYDTVFHSWAFSDGERSQWLMDMANIAMFKFSKKGSVLHRIKPKPDNNKETLQDWMYSCMKGIYFSDIALNKGRKITCVEGNNRRSLLSNFVNYIVNECAYKQEMFLGDFNEECFLNFINEKINTPCPVFYSSNNPTQYDVMRNKKQLMLCIKHSFQHAKYIGQPQPPDGSRKQQLSTDWERVDVYSPFPWRYIHDGVNGAWCKNSGSEDFTRLCSPRVGYQMIPQHVEL